MGQNLISNPSNSTMALLAANMPAFQAFFRSFQVLQRKNIFSKVMSTCCFTVSFPLLENVQKEAAFFSRLLPLEVEWRYLILRQLTCLSQDISAISRESLDPYQSDSNANLQNKMPRSQVLQDGQTRCGRGCSTNSVVITFNQTGQPCWQQTLILPNPPLQGGVQ